MRRQLIAICCVLILIAFGSCTDTPQVSRELYHPRASHIYSHLLASNDVVVYGTLDVPVEEVERAIETSKHGYVELTLRENKIIKGVVRDSIKFYWYTGDIFNLSTQQVIKSNGKKIVACLVEIEVEPDQGRPILYADAIGGLDLEPDREFINSLIDAQNLNGKLLGSYALLIEEEDIPLINQTRKLLNQTTDSSLQFDAFEKLEKLGVACVPALIYLMDNHSKLGRRSIVLENKHKGAFEAHRIYKPELVVDAVSSVLNQITGYSFREIQNGGTNRARQAEIEGWRLYLIHWWMDTNPAFAKRVKSLLRNS